MWITYVWRLITYYFWGLSFLIITSTISANSGSLSIFSSTFWILLWTVEWSFPPKESPMLLSPLSVYFLQRYIDIWRAVAMSWLLFVEIMSFTEILRCSETVLMIRSGVIVTFSSLEIRSLSIFFARSSVILMWPSSEYMLSLLRAPSSSRTL